MEPMRDQGVFHLTYGIGKLLNRKVCLTLAIRRGFTRAT